MYDVRNERKLQIPWEIEIFLFKMICPVITGAACSSSVINLLPSIPSPGIPGGICLTDELPEGVSIPLLRAPRANDWTD